MSRLDILKNKEQRLDRRPVYLYWPIIRKESIVISIILLIVIVGSLCLNLDYIENRDIIVIKLNASGFNQWQIKLDTTHDDYARIIHPLSDGGLMVAGNQMINHHSFLCELGNNCEMFENYPRIMIVNSDGSIREDKIFKKELEQEAIISLYETSNRSFLLSQHIGYLFGLDASGNVEWSTKPIGNESGRIEILSSIQTDENSFLIVGEGRQPGTYLMLGWIGEISPDGTLIWDHLYPGTKSFSMIAEGPDGGYTVVDNNNNLCFINNSRQFVWNSTLPGEVLAVRMNDGSIQALLHDREMTLNQKGVVTRIVTYTAGRPVIWTKDGGFASVNASGQLIRTYTYYTKDCTGLTLSKFDGSGRLQWNRTVPCTYGGEVISMVQTSDRGYGVLLYSEKRL